MCNVFVLLYLATNARINIRAFVAILQLKLYIF